jgi:DNA invertase Pin-like site-specific DNA recombinase
MFGIIACMAQSERELIREHVRSGIANAQAKGVHIGRPNVAVDAPGVARLRSEGRSWSEICQELGVSKGSAQRAFISVSAACAAD